LKLRVLSAKGRAGLRIVSAVLGLGILSGRMAPAEGAEPVTDHQVIILWPGGAPGAKGKDPEQDIPTLTDGLAREAGSGHGRRGCCLARRLLRNAGRRS